MTALDLALAALATFRITRLITADRITERLRAAAEERNELVGYLASCPWCVSFWIAIPVGAALVLEPTEPLVRIALAALALSALAGLLDGIDRRLDAD